MIRGRLGLVVLSASGALTVFPIAWARTDDAVGRSLLLVAGVLIAVALAALLVRRVAQLVQAHTRLLLPLLGAWVLISLCLLLLTTPHISELEWRVVAQTLISAGLMYVSITTPIDEAEDAEPVSEQS